MIARELTPEEKRALELYPELGDAFDSTLPLAERKQRFLPVIKKERLKLQAMEGELEVKRERKAWLERTDAALEPFEQWLNTPPVLEKNDCSRLHKLAESVRNSRVWFTGKDADEERDMARNAQLMFTDCHTFVVQHDWARAFEGATDYAEGEFKQPFPICTYEFRISGRNVIVWVGQNPDGDSEPSLAALPFVEIDGVWLCREEKSRDDAPTQFAWNQIRAICIALDAEVATRSVVRAPHKLNVKRERDGKCPLFDYSVVSLSRRVRTVGVNIGSASQGKKRLHFRRGHWRHYAEFKTWVRWTLVGNPELGFIDHEYRL